jgi:hypothetical protein
VVEKIERLRRQCWTGKQIAAATGEVHSAGQSLPRGVTINDLPHLHVRPPARAERSRGLAEEKADDRRRPFFAARRFGTRRRSVSFSKTSTTRRGV